MRTRPRRHRRAALAALGVLAVVAAGCSDTSTGTSTSSDSPSADSAALGTPNKATESVVKLGFVTDGKTDGIDTTKISDGAQATVDYANEYLGGLNGHVIELVTCSTDQTPSGGTACGVKMVKDGVVGVLVGQSGQDHSVFTALEGSGIPYMTHGTVDPDILGGVGAFVLGNPLGATTQPLAIAQEAGADKAAIIVIDVPAATGPVEAISQPLYDAAGVDLQMVPISAQVADPTPQVQQALSAGAKAFSIFGTVDFVSSVIKALKQLGFTGPMMTQVTDFPEELVSGIPGGLEGVMTFSQMTKDPHDRDVIIYNAVMSEAGVDPAGDEPEIGYATTLAFVKAANLTPGAEDAKSIMKALSNMPKSIPLPAGGGIIYQCGAGLLGLIPNACVSQTLQATLDKDGLPASEKVLG